MWFDRSARVGSRWIGVRRSAAMSLAVVCFWATGVAGSGQDSTMAAANAGQKWGLHTYRITAMNSGTAESRVDVELLGASSRLLGTYSRVRHFRIQDAPEIGGTKRFLQAEDVRLAWSGDVLEVTTDQRSGTFAVKLNGRDLGSVNPLTDSKRHSPELDTFLVSKSYLLELAEAISSDIDRAVPAARGAR